MKSIILAGISRSGKTTLARCLQKETGFSLISGDALMCTFETVYPDLGLSHDRDWKTVCKSWEDFIVVYLDHLVTYENVPFILDTCHFLPEQVKRLNLQEKYNILFLGYPTLTADEKLRAVRLHKTEHYDWTDDQNDDKELYQTISRFITNSQYIQSECAKLDLPFIDTGNDFNTSLENAYRTILQNRF